MPGYILIVFFVLGLYFVFSNIEELQEIKSRSNSTGIKVKYVTDSEGSKIQKLERIIILGLTLMMVGAWPLIKYIFLLLIP
jgi:hypothetical protein